MKGCYIYLTSLLNILNSRQDILGNTSIPCIERFGQVNRFTIKRLCGRFHKHFFNGVALIGFAFCIFP